MATIECATCGKDLPAEVQSDGALTASACPSCARKAEKAQAKEEPTSGREKATTVKESER